MAALVMRQLEMTREVSERQRAMKMGQALSNFVDGKLAFCQQAQKQDWPPPFQPSFHASSKASHRSAEAHVSGLSANSPQNLDGKVEPIQRTPSPVLPEESNTRDRQNTSSSSVRSSALDESDPEESTDLTFARAAYLIREALDVQGW
jgi:hypothetical protein